MFPVDRPRRLRHHPVLRDLVRETTLTVHDLIFPLFVRPGRGVKKEIASMPGNYQLSVDRLVDEVGAMRDLILPLFVRSGRGVKKEISSMPGHYQLSVDRLVDEVGAAADLGVRAFLLFGIPTHKDATGSSASGDDGIVQQALRALRQAHKDVLLITDECFCEYTDHGHCGVLS